jgi:hypothetical protein
MFMINMQIKLTSSVGAELEGDQDDEAAQTTKEDIGKQFKRSASIFSWLIMHRGRDLTRCDSHSNLWHN